MYIDGVFSGGGIKGFALIGACSVIEKKGFKFKRVAGTSAGSMIAAFIAAGYTSKEMEELIDEVDLSMFLDTRKTFIPMITKWLLLYWRLGLYKGEAIEKWLEEKLALKGIRTFSDLEPDALRVIASDLSNGTMMVLPDDLEKYGISINTFSVAKAIRMSISLPYFFEPIKLQVKNKTNIIVDGGVLSNFPMWLFDQDNITKTRPVLGVTLTQKSNVIVRNKIDNAINMFDALFETMKNAHDQRYISRRHEKNIIFIKSEGVATTEFKMTDEKKKKLIQLGEESAQQFLKTWSY